MWLEKGLGKKNMNLKTKEHYAYINEVFGYACHPGLIPSFSLLLKDTT